MDGLEDNKAAAPAGAKEVAKKIVSVASTVILILSMVIIFTVTMKTVMGKDPSIFGCRIFYIVTGSMEPTIPAGSAVLTHKSADNSYEIGDVITFMSKDSAIYGQPNTHRIVNIIDDNGRLAYVTKGDANSSSDTTLVYPEEVYGKVILSTGSLTGLGTFIGFILTPQGFISLIVLPIFAILFFINKDLFNAMKHKSVADSKKNIDDLDKQIAAMELLIATKQKELENAGGTEIPAKAVEIKAETPVESLVETTIEEAIETPIETAEVPGETPIETVETAEVPAETLVENENEEAETAEETTVEPEAEPVVSNNYTNKGNSNQVSYNNRNHRNNRNHSNNRNHNKNNRNHNKNNGSHSKYNGNHKNSHNKHGKR